MDAFSAAVVKRESLQKQYLRSTQTQTDEVKKGTELLNKKKKKVECHQESKKMKDKGNKINALEKQRSRTVKLN